VIKKVEKIGAVSQQITPEQEAAETAQHEASLVGSRGFIVNAVVPDSSTLIYSDTEYALFSVTMFRACVKDFTNRAREARYTIREFVPPAEGTRAGAALVDTLKSEREERKQELITFCKEWFKESFMAWIHLKALRTFVQSILRYGVPPEFQAILIAPHSSGDNPKLRQALNEQYSNLATATPDDEAASQHPSAFAFGTGKVYPYVYTELDIGMY